LDTFWVCFLQSWIQKLASASNQKLPAVDPSRLVTCAAEVWEDR